MKTKTETKELINNLYKISGCRTHKEFADQVGITETTASKLFRGYRGMTTTVLLRIVDKLGYELKLVKRGTTMLHKELILNEITWLMANISRIQDARSDVELKKLSETAKEHLNRIIEFKQQELEENE